MMDAFDIRNMYGLLRCNKKPAELHHAGFIYYNLHDARNHENQIHVPVRYTANHQSPASVLWRMPSYCSSPDIS